MIAALKMDVRIVQLVISLMILMMCRNVHNAWTIVCPVHLNKIVLNVNQDIILINYAKLVQANMIIALYVHQLNALNAIIVIIYRKKENVLNVKKIVYHAQAQYVINALVNINHIKIFVYSVLRTANNVYKMSKINK